MNQPVLRRAAHAVPIHDEAAFARMRRAGKLCAQVLDMIGAEVRAGVTTGDLDKRCHAFIRDHGATPAPYRYRGYPKATCISVNEVVCHGIPGERVLKDGDSLNIDVTVIKDGWHGDSSRMYFVGEPDAGTRHHCQITFEAMWRGIRAARPGATLGDLGHAIQSYAEAHGRGIVREYCGHGIGRVFHDAPTVLHYGQPKQGMRLEAGMIFTIEPMLNAGGPHVRLLADGWTVETADRSISAQFEHTVGITDGGAEVFTLSPAGLHHPAW